MSRPRRGAWQGYVGRFHARHPGITEAVLAGALDEGTDPYRWVADGVPAGGRVLDVACGSGPVRAARPPGEAGTWVGVDRSPAELALARRHLPVVRADAGALPVGDAAVDAAVVAMGLMVVDDPVGLALAVARALRPGGTLSVLVPAAGPLTPTDVARWGRLLLPLGHVQLPFPSPAAVRDPRAVLGVAGLTVVADDRRRFALPVRSPAHAEVLVDSLYLPGVSPAALARARRRAGALAGHDLGLPLRRLVAVRPTG